MADETLVATIRADLSQFQASMRQMVAEVQQASRASAQQTEAMRQGFQRAGRDVQTLNAEMARLSKGVQQTTQASSQGLTAMAQGFRGVQQAAAAFGVTLTALGLATFARAAIQASTQMIAFEQAFKGVTGSMIAAKEEMAFVQRQAQRLGVDITSATQHYLSMSAAARGTVLEGAAVKEVFLGIAEAARSMGLSQERTALAFTAVSQMMSKGRVTAEELNQQLAEALPQAIGVLGRALRKSTPDLQAFITAGRVGLPELMLFGRQLRLEAAANIQAMGDTFEAAATRVGNAGKAWLAALGEILTKNPEIIRAMNALATAAEEQAKKQGGLGAQLAQTISYLVRLAEVSHTAAQSYRSALDAAITEVDSRLTAFLKGNANRFIQWLKDVGVLLPSVQLPFGEGGAKLPWEPGGGLALPPELHLRRQVITAQRLPFAGPAMEGPEAASVGLFDPGRSRETLLMPIKKTLEEIHQLQQDIQARKDILNTKELHLSALQVQAVKTELAEMEKKLRTLQEPADNAAKAIEKVATAGDLKDQITRLQAYIEAHKGNAEATAIAVAQLEKLQDKYHELTLATLPESVKAFRLLNEELTRAKTRFEAMAASLSPEELRLATAEIQAREQRLKDFYDNSLQLDKEYAEKTIALMRDRLEKQKQLDEELLDHQQDTMERFRQIQKEGWEGSEKLLEQAFELQKALARTPAEAEQAWQDYMKSLEQAGVDQERVLQERFRHQLDMARKAQDDFTRLVDQISDKVGDVMFGWLDTITSEAMSVKEVWRQTLSSLKDMFLRTFAEMAAKALTTEILLKVGVAGTGTTGTGVGIVQNLLKAIGLGGSAVPGRTSTSLPSGNVEILAGGTPPATAGAGGSLSTANAAGAIGAGIGVGYMANSLFARTGVSPTGARVASGALGGAVAGTMIAPGIGTAIGAGVGALIPAMMNPRLRETLLLSSVGRWFGIPDLLKGNIGEGLLDLVTLGIGGTLKRIFGDKPQNLTYAALQTSATPHANFLEGISQESPFGFVGAPQGLLQRGSGKHVLGMHPMAWAEMFADIDRTLASYLDREQRALAAAALQHEGVGITKAFKQFDNELAALTVDRMSTILESLAAGQGLSKAEQATFTAKAFQGIELTKDNLEALEQAFADATQFMTVLAEVTRPGTPISQAEQALKDLNAQFDVLIDQTEHYGIATAALEHARARETVRFLGTIRDNLEAQQQTVLRGIQGTRQVIAEALDTPAVVFARRQDELTQLQGEFLGAGPAAQVAMVPDLLSRIQELLQLGSNETVLGQDQTQLRALQRDLLAFLDEIEQRAGQDAFDQQIAKAQEQIDAVKALHRVTEDQLTSMNTTLANIERFLARAAHEFVGSFQQGGLVPQTGLALVHQGERVVPVPQVRTIERIMQTMQAPALPFVGSFQQGGLVPQTGLALVHRGETIVAGPVSAPMTLNMEVTVHAAGTDQRSLTQTGEQIGQAAWGWIANAARLRRIPLKLEK